MIKKLNIAVKGKPETAFSLSTPDRLCASRGLLVLVRGGFLFLFGINDTMTRQMTKIKLFVIRKLYIIIH